MTRSIAHTYIARGRKVLSKSSFQAYAILRQYRPVNITGSAVALHCGKAHVQSQWEREYLTPNDIKISDFFRFEHDVHDYVPETTSVQIFISISSAGVSPQIGEILRFYDFFAGWLIGYTLFFSRARSQVKPVDAFSRFMAHIRRVFAQGWTDWWSLLGLR